MKNRRRRQNKIVPFDYFLEKIADVQSLKKIPYQQIVNLRRKFAIANYSPEKMDFIRHALYELDKRAVYSSPKPTQSTSVHLIYNRNG